MNIENALMNCRLCPRQCGADRFHGQTGVCKMTSQIKLARAALHMWEEPCISGTKGSGTVFFSGCSLHCVYCQNKQIANGSIGKEVSTERLVQIFLELQGKGAHNINLVSPSHYVLQIKEAVLLARAEGLSIPIVYNTSGYERVCVLKELDGIVDVYLTDFKYWYPKLAKKYSGAPDYKEVAVEALAEMARQCKHARFDAQGMMTRGIIVRNLLLPGQVENSMEIVRYVYETYKDELYISLMNQYTPVAEELSRYPEINRKVTEEEYEKLVDYAIDLGIENGFIQEGETASESFIPSFDYEGV